MAKTRVHVLAKELQVASADVIHHANSLGIEVKTASSGLTEEEVELIKLSIIPSVEDKEDIANMSVFLLSKEAHRISGQTMVVDGNTERMN